MGDQSGGKSSESVGHRIIRAMFVIIFFQLFWKFGGLIITLLVGSVFGSSPESDAYFFVSETVIFLLQTLCLKVFIPVVVPIFKEQLSTEGEKAAWRFGSTVLTITIVVLALVTIGGIAFAPKITSLVAEGFNERQAALTTRLMRWTFPGVFAICLATVTYALLNSYNVFGYAAAGDAAQKTLWAGIFLVAAVTGLSVAQKLDALAIAFLAGAGATLLVHLLGLRSKLRFLRLGFPGLSWRRIGIELGILAAHVGLLGAGLLACRALGPFLPSESAVLVLQQAALILVVSAYLMLLWWRARGRRTAMAKFAALVVPLLFGILFAKYRDVLTNLFASFTGTGVFSDLKYARKIGEAPNTLVIAALSIAILPHLCELATGRRWDEFGDVMTKTVRCIVIFFVPLAALTVVLRRPIIQLLFDRGNWTDYHLYHAGDALGLYILSLPFFAIENPIQQSFFAMQRMWTPTLVGFLGTGFHILFLFVGIEWLGFGYFGVVALVYVAARAFKNIILLSVMRYHVKILPWRESIVFLAKALAVTFVVVLVAHYLYQPLKSRLSLEPYRRKEVVLDTFNVELSGWESDNVDDFRIVPKDDEVLGEVLGAVAAVHGENALIARYRRSPRRAAGLRRDLSGVDLQRVASILCTITVDRPAQLSFEFVTRDRRSFPHPPVDASAGAASRVALDVADFPLGDSVADVVGLWVRDVTPASRVEAVLTTLILDDVALAPDGDGASPVSLDTFEPTTATWHVAERPGAATGSPAAVADTGEREKEPELALHLPADAAARTVVHQGLRVLGLAECDRLTFKARADKPCRLDVALLPAPAAEGADAPTHAVDIEAGERRKTYSVAIEPSGALRAVAFQVPAGVDFWLDNVVFVREPRGPKVRGASVMYEVTKLIHVLVPSAAAFAVFVVLLFVLRVREAKDAWSWLREKALGKLLGKLGRKA